MKRGERLPSLGAYLALATTVMSVLLTLLLTLVIERTAGDDVASGIGSNLAELAGQTAGRLDRAIFERYREIELMAARLGRQDDWAAMQPELDAAHKTYRFYAWLGVADAKGIVRVASGGVLQGVDVSARPWFHRAPRGQHLDDVHDALLLARALGAADSAAPRFFDIAFPLHPGGGATPVLAAHVSWDWAMDLKQAIFGAHGDASVEPLIVDTQGLVLLGPPGLQGRKLALTSLAQASAGKTGYSIEAWPDGKRYLVGFAPSRPFLGSPGLGWRVLVRQDLDRAYEPVQELKQHVILGGAALALLFSLAGWLLARKVTAPLLDLAKAARRLETGEGGEVRPSRAYREVAQLGTALNSLLRKLDDKGGELRALNALLEHRVEQRTAELREAFERVQTNEHRIQTIIEAAQDPFIGLDLQGCITDWNSRAEAMFGWAREEVLGRPVSDVLLPPGRAGELEQQLGDFLRTGGAVALRQPIERRLVDRHGREIDVEVQIGLVATGEERFFSAFVHDISQRKEVERMKDEFISTVSHELRTPLTAIYGSLDLLASGMAGDLPPDAHQLLAISHQSTERLIRLINDMLDLEKIASGRIEYRMAVQPLRPLVEQAIRDTAGYADSLRVRIALHGDADAQVRVDADRIVQVCVNLLSNAVKFSSPDSAVDVTVAVQEGRARVGVVDRGPGVPPEFRDRIFERFAQADSSERRAKGGTGLGLAICRSIVEAHGGELAFTSEPGVRTEFFFALPLAD